MGQACPMKQSAKQAGQAPLSRHRYGQAIGLAEPQSAAGYGQGEAQGNASVGGMSKILVDQNVTAAKLQQTCGMRRIGGQGAVARQHIVKGRNHGASSPSQNRMEQMHPSMPTAPAR